MSPGTIFVVDDDADVAAGLANELAAPGRNIYTFSDPLEALAALPVLHVDLLITDLSMPWADGESLITAAHKRQPEMQILVISGHERAEQLARKKGVLLLKKPCDLLALEEAVEERLQSG
jgi:DNA-binding NtrC family response regulator